MLMRSEELYHHYSNIEHQRRLPTNLQDKKLIMQSNAALDKIKNITPTKNAKPNSKK